MEVVPQNAFVTVLSDTEERKKAQLCTGGDLGKYGCTSASPKFRDKQMNFNYPQQQKRFLVLNWVDSLIALKCK